LSDESNKDPLGKIRHDLRTPINQILGQARRALIARALVGRPRVLLLDEPWEGLDADSAALLNATLRTVIAGGTQLVCASHLAAHREMFTHELALQAGRVAQAGRIE
jgi:ABC-type molybdenum transport system ATPase subunit/photorepair protein PhrA